MDAYSWSPELDGRLRPWLSAFPPCLPDPDPGLGRGAAAWDVDVGRTRSGEVSSFPSGLCDRKEETEAYLSASCMLTPGSNHPGVPPIPCCWGWRVWGRLREPAGGGLTAGRVRLPRPRPTPSPGAQPAVCGLLSSTAAALLAVGCSTFFGWPDTSWLAACERVPLCPGCSPASLQTPPPVPAGQRRGQARPPRPHAQTDLAAPGGCRWPRRAPLGYFWPPCWPADSPPKAITGFSSCFADSLEYVKNVPRGDSRAPRGVGGGGSGAQLWPGPPGSASGVAGETEAGRGQARAVRSRRCRAFRAATCVQTRAHAPPCW